METNTQMPVRPEPMQNSSAMPHPADDYRNALIVGIIIGVFALPVIYQLGAEGKLAFLSNNTLTYVAALLGFPIISLAGIFIAKMLVSRIPSLWEFAKFALVGVSNTIVDLGIYNFLIGVTDIHLPVPLALFAGIAFIIATINSYFWNSHWSFKTNTYRSAKEMIKFFGVTVTGLLLKVVVIYVALKYFTPAISGELWENLANLMSIVVTLVWNFIGFKFFVFKTGKVQ